MAPEALLTLLDDPDPQVRSTLHAQLARDRELLDATWRAAIARASEVPPGLSELVLATDAEELIDAFAAVEDLAGGIWVLPLLHQPRHDWRTAGAAAIQGLAARAQALPGRLDGGRLAQFLGEDLGFSGDTVDYHDPRNSFLPCVLERRCGLPIAVTALWLLVARLCHLDCEAIAAPGHVVGRWRSPSEGLHPEWHYVDCFAGGVPITLAELEARSTAMGEVSILPYLSAASDRALLRRMARNLVHAYAKRGDRVRATIAHGMAHA